VKLSSPGRKNWGGREESPEESPARADVTGLRQEQETAETAR
jgi:hypothetical protein